MSDREVHPHHHHVHHRPEHERFHKLAPFAYVDKHEPHSGNSSGSNLALIFGWFGGSIRHVAKYVPLYHKRGYRVIVVTSSFDSQPDWFRTFADADAGVPPFIPIADYVVAHFSSALLPAESSTDSQSALIAPNHVAVHVFSNGGTSQFYYFLQAMKRIGKRLHAKALIADSTPSAGATVNAMSRFFLGSLNYRPTTLNLLFAKAVATIVFVILHTMRITAGGLFRMAWMLRLTQKKVDMRQENNAVDLGRKALLANEMRLANRLFVYSDNDQVVTAKEVSSFVKLTRDTLSSSHKPSGSITELRFAKSGHVRHLCEEYEIQLAELLDKCK
ncbi:Transmembrane protein 53 [Gonapodya sp. JEL0774]|nr:Transmembrane protein 53 [Gonapodya sp. JEL0774]